MKIIRTQFYTAFVEVNFHLLSSALACMHVCACSQTHSHTHCLRSQWKGTLPAFHLTVVGLNPTQTYKDFYMIAVNATN